VTQAGSHSPRWLRVGGGVALALAAAAGLYARFRGLGERPLAVDEYFFARGVAAILRHGVPALPGGGYYNHGVLAQYAIAMPAALLGESAFALRLVPVLMNLACAGALYLFARRRVGGALAATCAALLLLSSWEIEFARFARMYAQHQLLTLCFFWSVDRVFFESPGSRWRFAPHVLAVVATFTHPLGLFLFPFLLLPLVLPSAPARFRGVARGAAYAGGTLLLAAVTAVAARFDWRHLGVRGAAPAGWAPNSRPLLHLPEFPFWNPGADPRGDLALLCAFVAACGIALAALALWRRAGGRPRREHAFAALLVLSSVFHQLLLAGASAALLVGRCGVLRAPRSLPARRVGVAALAFGAVAAALWLGLAFAGRDALVAASGGSFPGVVRRTFFGWPDLFGPAVSPWARELPRLGLLLAAGIAWEIGRLLPAPRQELLRSPALWVLALLAILGTLSSLYATTRYSFFLYPLALLASASALRDLCSRLLSGAPAWAPAPAAAALLALAFAAGDDFHPRHIARVASDEAAYRTGIFARFSSTWYLRSDYASVGRWLAQARARGDDAPIIVVGEPPISYYLDAPHAVYYGREDPRFADVTREGGTRELWSQQRLLSTPAELRAFTAGATRVLLARSTLPARQAFRPEAVWGSRLRTVASRFRSVDGRLEVVEVRLAP
jgi:hypothetical protein